MTACVSSPGVTLSTVKHSGFVVAGGGGTPLSVASGTPVVPEVNFPNQQYRPADVRVAVPGCAASMNELIGWLVDWFTVLLLTSTPPSVHTPLANGPQR